MQKSGRQDFLVDGFPRNADNLAGTWPHWWRQQCTHTVFEQAGSV